MHLVWNKHHLKREESNDLINQFKEEYKDFKYYETSTKDDIGINKIFLDLAEDLYKILFKEGGNRSDKSQKKHKYDDKKSNKGNWICSSTSEFTKNKD